VATDPRRRNAAIVAAVLRDETRAEIAARHGVSETWVTVIARRAGVPPRNGWAWASTPVEDALRLTPWRTNATIAREHGVSSSTVLRARARLGIAPVSQAARDDLMPRRRGKGKTK